MRRIGATVLICCALAACGQRDKNAGRQVPIRLPLSVASASTPEAVTPIVPNVPMGWTSAPSARAAWYGPANAPAQLAVSCEGWQRHAARLRIVRFVPADEGAEAVLAIQGSKGILRLPVSAVKAGKDYTWRGEIEASDPRAEVLLGTGLKATVPGGGMLMMAPMGAAGTLVGDCIRDAAPAQTQATQTLPNLPSNPATSPAAR